MATPRIDAPARVTAVLKSFGADGGNAGNLVIYADGTVKLFGDHSLTRAALEILLRRAVSSLPECVAAGAGH